MFWLVCYDTPSNRRRRRFARTLQDFAMRVQKSVFETHLPAGAFEKMLKKLTAIVDKSEDSLRLYPMPADSLAGVKLFGRPELTRPHDFFWAGKGA